MPWRDVLDFLPWRKRRKEYSTADEEAEAVELRQEDILNPVSSNGDMKDGTKTPVRYKGSGMRRAEGETGLGLLSVLMNSDEFQKGDPTCVNFLKYIYQGNIDGLSEFLNNFSSKELEGIEIGGQGLLHVLCFKKDVVALRLVLAHDVNPNIVNSDGVTPLHLAVSEEWTEGAEVLLTYGAAANILPQTTRTFGATSNLEPPVDSGFSSWPFQELPVLTAARNGDFETASILLDQSPNLRLTDNERNSALHLACFSHNIDLVERLLQDKYIVSEISSSNNKGNTALHCLMAGENLPTYEEEILESVKLLIHKGANVNQVNVANRTPLYLAARYNLPMVVKYLMEAGANPKIKSRDGRTVLHAACRAGSHESLSLLLENGRASHLVLVEDTFGYSPFHLAVSSCSISCCEVLIQNGDHLTRLDSQGRSRCSLVLKNMPSAVQLLKRIFDSNIELPDHDIDDPQFQIKMDFSVLLSKTSNDVEASLISDFNSSDVDSLLKHPLVESFLYLKWHKIRWFFYMYVFIYFLFLIVHTYYIVKTYAMNTDWHYEPDVLMMVHVTHIIMVLLLMIPGTITIFANIRKYFKQWETYFKVIALSTAAFIVFARETTFRNKEAETNVAAVSVFFTWVEFMMLMGRFPALGVYILMFTRVSKSIVLFLLAFSPLLIAFTLSFGILLKSIELFSSFPTAFVKILMMMIGEIDYGDIYEDTKTDSPVTVVISHIFLVVFLFLIPVLMANLLIGIAVNDLPDLQYHGKVRRLVKQASYLESYERLLLVFKEWTYIPLPIINLFSGRGSIKREIVIYPNKMNKYGMNTHIIPSDAISDAIESGTRVSSENVEDLDTSFRRFFREYECDRERIEKAIDVLHNTLVCMDKKGTDVPDSAFKYKKNRHSMKKH